MIDHMVLFSAVPWNAIWAVVKSVLEAALVLFAGTQLYLQRASERDRLRVAYSALYAEFWRIVALQMELENEDLVRLARNKLLVAERFSIRDWGMMIQLMGEVSSSMAAFGGYAYARLDMASTKVRQLIETTQSTTSDELAKTFAPQIKRALNDAVALLEDGFRAAPTWLAEHEFMLVDPQSDMGKRVERMLLQRRAAMRGRRHEPRLGFLGKHLGNTLARLGRWFNPAA